GQSPRPQLARCSGGKLRTAGRTRSVPVLRIVRSAKYSRNRKRVTSERRRTNYHYAADQALSRRENVVRAILASAAARILATRTWRQILHQVTGNNSLLLAARSNSLAPACRHSAFGNSRLARGGEV